MMQFNFGDNLKALRTEKGLTQEQTAELLNVSKQSISRWENNTTCPDISFLPIIASFYGVTIDRLLGADYETNKKILSEYYTERHKAHQEGDMQCAYDLSQRMYARFPNETVVLNNLMVDSYLMGFHNVNGKKQHYLELSLSIAKRFLKMTDDLNEQSRCIKNISTCYKLLGNQEKAVSWVKKLPSIWSGMETTRLGVLEGQDKIDSIQESLEAALHLLHRLIYVYAENTALPLTNRIAILSKTPKLFEILFENGDYGLFHAFLAHIYVEIAKLEAENGNTNASMEALHKAALYAKEFDQLVTSEHTSLLFEKRSILPGEFTKASNHTQCELVLKQLSGAAFYGMLDRADFQQIIEQLSV